jgi:hypothetical protein
MGGSGRVLFDPWGGGGQEGAHKGKKSAVSVLEKEGKKEDKGKKPQRQ